MDLSRAGLGRILIIGTPCVAVSCGPGGADNGPGPRPPGAAAQDLPSLAKYLVILVEVCLLFQYMDKTTAVLFLCGRHELGKYVHISWAAMLVFKSVQGLAPMNVHHKYEIN